MVGARRLGTLHCETITSSTIFMVLVIHLLTTVRFVEREIDDVHAKPRHLDTKRQVKKSREFNLVRTFRIESWQTLSDKKNETRQWHLVNSA